ncbi:MAG TPA: anhydro-N-acetylmuramic acid kinase [Ignavibacteria bacterium]
MNRLFRIEEKTEKIIIGILSGTSLDGADVVLTKVVGNGENIKISVLDFYTNPYPIDLKEFILKCSSNSSSNVEDICRLNFILGHFFAESIKILLKNNRFNALNVDLIGSHGQTVYHIPKFENLFSFSTKSTLQLGDPSVIANLTGINTIGDFRVADVAVGGDGAPLVPFMDYIMFRNKEISRVLINIGGISNITYLKKNGKFKDVIAFDTGPGNMIIDGLMRKFFSKDFDQDAEIANSGKINKELFNFICSIDEYPKIPPPKSTGRERYNNDFLNFIVSYSEKLIPSDIIRTVSEYTAFSIFKGVSDFINDKNIKEILISGGGVLNPCIMNSLSNYFKGVEVKKLDYQGITTENKESVLFAILANETVLGNKANLRSVTNANKNVILGKICLAE